MYDAYLNPKDALRPIVVAFEAVQFVTLDPEDTDLTYELIARALETVARALTAQRNSPESKNV